MDRSVAHLNIAHFKALLQSEQDEKKREIIQRLLSEEEAKLAKFLQESKKKPI